MMRKSEVKSTLCFRHSRLDFITFFLLGQIDGEVVRGAHFGGFDDEEDEAVEGQVCFYAIQQAPV
jgi:hypothetical protein